MKHLTEGPTVSAPVIEFTDEEMKRERGTFCGVVGKNLVTSYCPLPNGACMWKHRQTGVCKFTNQSVTVSEFAHRVGLPGIDGPTANVLRATLKNAVYKELSR